MKYYVYKITNNINDKVYIGQTTENLKHRFSRHKGYQLNQGDKIHRAMKKYGTENFNISLVEEVDSQEKLNKREYFWINELNTINKGYNINNDGKKCGGDTLSSHPDKDNIYKKISKSVMGGKNHKAQAVRAINVITDETFEYECLQDCVKDLDLKTHKNITRITLNGKKTPYKGTWMFKYIEGIESKM